jgi:hypothetical protein
VVGFEPQGVERAEATAKQVRSRTGLLVWFTASSFAGRLAIIAGMAGVEVVKQTVAMVVERVGRVPGNEATAVDVARSAGAVMVLAAKAAMLVVEVTS